MRRWQSRRRSGPISSSWTCRCLNLGGIDATIQLRKILPGVEILILTMHESDQLVGQALRAGARGYLLKSESEDKLMEALEALSNHQPYFSPSVSETLLQGYLNSEPTVDPKQLTPRERQIVKLVAEGRPTSASRSSSASASRRSKRIGPSAMHKIGAKSSADLTLYAARNELVEI